MLFSFKTLFVFFSVLLIGSVSVWFYFTNKTVVDTGRDVTFQDIAHRDDATSGKSTVGDYTLQSMTYVKEHIRKLSAYADRHTRSYYTCDKVYLVFPNGFKQLEDDYDVTDTSSIQRSDVPVRSELYENNRELDTDHDGYVCERPAS